jgi:nitrite reductase/ring-hydroxylating ferredoxin subunit
MRSTLDTPRMNPTRRVLLCCSAGLSAGLLAGCDTSRPAKAVQPPPPSGPPAVPAADALAKTADIPVGGGVVSGSVLVVQPAQGEFKAYDAACPHKGVLVNAPAGGIATCPAHKSTFDIKDGARVSGPAATGLKEIPVKVENGAVVRAQ